MSYLRVTKRTTEREQEEFRAQCESAGLPVVWVVEPDGYPAEGQPTILLTTFYMRVQPTESERRAISNALAKAGRVVRAGQEWAFFPKFDALESEWATALTRAFHILGALPPTPEEQYAEELLAKIFGSRA